MKLPDHPLLRALRALGLRENDFAVFGSGPMWAHGLAELHDFDVIARGAAWEFAKANGVPFTLPDGRTFYHFADGNIEIGNSWAPGEWDIASLIDAAEVIDGIRFVKLAEVLAWKRLMARPKDMEHVKLIQEYMHN